MEKFRPPYSRRVSAVTTASSPVTVVKRTLNPGFPRLRTPSQRTYPSLLVRQYIKN